MAKIKFKCKGFLPNGDPCDQYVTAKAHKGIGAYRVAIKKSDGAATADVLKQLDEGVPEVPPDWEFTLRCRRGHEFDYTYDERET